MTCKNKWSYVAVLLFFAAAIYVDISVHKWSRNAVLVFDIAGYHHYLPATFIYHDILKYDFLDSLDVKYAFTQGLQKKFGLHPTPKNHNLCNQYPMGVSIFQLPAFAIAHAWAVATKQHPADGYSSPYQHGVVLSTLFFAVLALIILILFLKHYFSDKVIFFTLILLSFGTNFFQYATLDSGFSHIYLFFLYASVLYLSLLWYQKATVLNSILMGMCIGLAAITRPIDILICIIPLCWQSTTIPKLTYWRTNYSYILLIIGVTFLTCLPQLLYWKFVSGQWIYFSYSINDYFSFNRFRVMHGLFSYRKGWFIYTPLALLAFCQMFSIRKESIFEGYKNVFWAFFIPMIYLVFSWHNWFYGWSFGCRALIGTLPLLAIPLALTLKHISESSKLKQVVMSSVLLFFVYLNLFQTWQFNNSILHGTLMNETTYWKVFLKTKKPSSVDKCHELQQEMDWNTGE